MEEGEEGVLKLGDNLYIAYKIVEDKSKNLYIIFLLSVPLSTKVKIYFFFSNNTRNIKFVNLV